MFASRCLLLQLAAAAFSVSSASELLRQGGNGANDKAANHRVLCEEDDEGEHYKINVVEDTNMFNIGFAVDPDQDIFTGTSALVTNVKHRCLDYGTLNFQGFDGFGDDSVSIIESNFLADYNDMSEDDEGDGDCSMDQVLWWECDEIPVLIPYCPVSEVYVYPHLVFDHRDCMRFMCSTAGEKVWMMSLCEYAYCTYLGDDAKAANPLKKKYNNRKDLTGNEP